MRTFRARFIALLPLVATAAMLCARTAELGAQALPSDRTYIRFGNAVRVPGATLEPGTYLFVLGNPVGGQSVIDIYTGDASRLVVTCLGVQSFMPRPETATMIDYPSTSPLALRAWFHPGNAIGFEFVYSAGEAKTLFLQSGVAVPFAPFKAVNRELVGAFPIAMSGVAPPVGSRPVGTSGVLPSFDEELDAHGHLTQARRVIVNHLPNVTGIDHSRLVLLQSQVEDLQRAYRAHAKKDIEKWIGVVNRSIENLLPREQKASNYAEMIRIDPATSAVIERVGAHVKAFARVAR